jgi:uncharacterized protein
MSKRSKTNSLHTADAATTDSFKNFAAHVGRGTGNQNDASHYGFNPVTRNRLQMEYVYRGSWIAGMAVDCVAQDMTREGIEINSTDAPHKLQELDKEASRLRLWDQLCQTIKWARLYGGAVAFLMIDGQKPDTQLRLETLQKGQFKGLLPMDRWMLNCSITELVEDFGPEFGLPLWYDTVPDTGGMPAMRIHHSRIIRLEGVRLPYWQRQYEWLWGQSVLERLWDRLIAFDSTTNGVAQLVYKAHLRTYSVEGLRDIIAQGGPAMKALAKQMEMIRSLQNSEGITLMDAKDKFETHQYAFSGLDQVLLQFGQQLSGALGIPLVRLFGQSPAGLNATGESDMRLYYDSIKQQQVATLGPGIETLYRVLYISKFGTEPPKQFDIDFKNLWQMSDHEKSQVTNTTTAAINTAYESQIINRATALKELKQLSRVTGCFSNVTDEDINAAEDDPAPSPEVLGLVAPKSAEPGQPSGAAKPNANKAGGTGVRAVA